MQPFIAADKLHLFLSLSCTPLPSSSFRSYLPIPHLLDSFFNAFAHRLERMTLNSWSTMKLCDVHCNHNGQKLLGFYQDAKKQQQPNKKKTKNHWTKNRKIKIPNCMTRCHLPYTEIKVIGRSLAHTSLYRHTYRNTPEMILYASVQLFCQCFPSSSICRHLQHCVGDWRQQAEYVYWLVYLQVVGSHIWLRRATTVCPKALSFLLHDRLRSSTYWDFVHEARQYKPNISVNYAKPAIRLSHCEHIPTVPSTLCEINSWTWYRCVSGSSYLS